MMKFIVYIIKVKLVYNYSYTCDVAMVYLALNYMLDAFKMHVILYTIKIL